MTAYNLDFNSAMLKVASGKRVTGENFVDGYFFFKDEFGFFKLGDLNNPLFEQNLRVSEKTIKQKFKVLYWCVF